MDTKTKKLLLLNKLYSSYANCTACPLANFGRTNIVFGDGNPNAQLMIIGEAPGKNEDLQGHPFIGRSGQLLTRSLQQAGLNREDVFITNIVKCRPPNNRNPLPLEIKTCKQLLLFKQIKIIQPKIICTLGALALEGLTNQRNIKITKTRGIPLNIDGITIIPTYHPAYMLRKPKELNTFIKDLKQAHLLLNSQIKK